MLMRREDYFADGAVSVLMAGMALYMVSKIYFDLDGVLADFDRGVMELAGFNRNGANANSDIKGEYDVENLFDGDWDHKEE